MRNTNPKIKGMNGFIRDSRTGAILNTNKEEIRNFQALRASEDRLNTVEEDIKEIKYLLRKLLGESK